MTTILVTGGAGFIGSNYLLDHRRRHPEDRLINVDCLTYAGNLENLTSLEGDENYRFIRCDISDRAALEAAIDEPIDHVVHFAAESHVDRSIEDASAFLSTNVIGTQNLIDVARSRSVERFVHVSTDEVYGSADDGGFFVETTPLAPNSPYSASKAASDMLVRAAFQTHGFPAVITRCSNNYGPYQFPEKLIPLMISNVLEKKALPVYGDGQNVRDWIHVIDHCRGIDLARTKGTPGSVYNFGARNETSNLDIIHQILERLDGSPELITFVTDRKGHDRRYAIDPQLAEDELGFAPSVTFAEGLADTVDWYVASRTWWEHIKSGAYREYYRKMYDGR